MPEYRAYHLGPDGRLGSTTALRCDDDADAIDQAKKIGDVHAIEVWRANRLVTRIGSPSGTNGQKPA
jgi:hypothetical protein